VETTVATAGALLREARLRSGLTQAELARRAGVTQSVISAYESGRRQPALTTLASLIWSAGLEMTVTLHPVPNAARTLTGPVGQVVRQRRQELVAAAAAHGATNLRAFGSVARGEDRPDSDLDLLVDLPASMGLLGLGRLEKDLEAALDGVRVDVVPATDPKPDVRRRIENDVVPL